MKESITSLFGLKGKVAIVTGGNGGIGRGIVRGLAGAGATVAIAARNEARMEHVMAEIRQDFGTGVIGIRTDVRKPDDIDAMVRQVADRFGRVDIVVANAGTGCSKPAIALSLEEWEEDMETNLRHTFVLSKAAYPHLVASGGGKIITMGSMTSIFGIDVLASYGASKGGVLQLTRSLAVAWARDGIQVNCILPGFFDPGLAAKPRREIPGFDEAVAGRTPAGRWGTPADLVGVVVFLSSPASDFVTGAAIPVDGGYAAQG